jgi:hypothetical protein
VKVSFLGDAFMVADMSMRSVLRASLLNSASKVLMKGLRDMGLLAELLRSDWLAGEGKPGDVALLRKGLLEDRLMERPGDGRRSAADKVSTGAQERDPPISSQNAGRLVKRAPIGELPGIDGSASMLLPLSRNPAIAAIMPNQTREAGRLQVGDGWLALVTRKQSQILFLRNGTTRRHGAWSSWSGAVH